MPESPPQSSPAADAVPPAGRLVLLIDESGAMGAPVAGGTKSKADSVATAVNSLLNQLGALPAVEVAVVGYRADESGSPDVGFRWQGPLAGRRFVATPQLAESPVEVQERVRRVPGTDGVGVLREESVRFPIWYVPRLGGSARLGAARSFCRQLLAERSASGGASARPPLVLHLLGELPEEEDAAQRPAGEGSPREDTTAAVICHAHLGSSARIPPTLYPSGNVHLPPGPLRGLFGRSSRLPPPLAAALRHAGVNLGPNARGLIHNATMGDLIRFLALAKSYASWEAALEPASTATFAMAASKTAASTGDAAAQPERPGSSPEGAADRLLVLFVLDRSVADPRAGSESTVWHRLQRQANALLGEIARRADGRIDVAAVAYGAGAEGQVEVATALGGPLAGQTVVSAAALAGGALRTDEVSEQVSNGIGGLLTLTRRRPVYIDLAPAAAAPPQAAFAAAAECLAGWRPEEGPSGAVLLHFTRGAASGEETAAAAAQLAAPQGPWLYHLVLTESPYRSIAYPDDPASIDDPRLEALCRHASPLAGASQIAQRRPAVSPRARGLVVNGRFDLLPACLEALLRPPAEEGDDT